MTSQESFANLNIYFVVPEKYNSEEECSEEMWEAYNLCIQNEFQPQWVEEKDCLSLKTEKTDVFIMQEFEGAAFEKLSTSKCFRIIGPLCVVTCFLSGELIPEGNSPVFTTAMRGITVCVTGLQPEVKADIEKKVQYMGGIFMKQLKSCVTHLISNSVMSAKYEMATEQKIPVFTNRWIDAIWKANVKSFVKADDPRFDRYKCPVFMDLVVTATSLSKQQKEEAKKLINDYGGTFMGALDGTRVKIVLAPPNCPLTDKLKYAEQNHIACLDVVWVKKCITAGYALPFKDYLIKSTQGCSTPEKSQAPMLDLSAISAINGPRYTKNMIEESMMTTMNSTAMSDTVAADRQFLAPYVGKLEKLDIREAKLAGPFLDGCNIYLAGFPANHRDKMNRILNAGGATRLDDISDALTHVLVGDPNKAANELKLMQARGLNPYILGLDWLEESLRLQHPAPEENFVREKKQSTNEKAAEPPSPLSKKNLQMLQRPKRPPVPQFDIDQEITSEHAEDIEEEASLVQQYLQKANSDSNAAEFSFHELIMPKNSTMREGTVITNSVESFNVTKNSKSKEMTPKDPVNDSAVPYSQSISDKIFEGLTFLVSGFDAEEGSIVTQNIDALGGRIVSNSFAGVPDYGVVPLIGATLKHTVDEVVTDLFIENCIDCDAVVELMYYHRPLSISPEAKPLAGLVIATSTYAGTERSYLTKVAIALGAKYQDTFARKTHPEKNHLGSTHLLCPLPEGNKYNAAVKWKLPAVISDWLRACASESRRVDETSYLVGETMAPERPQNSADTSNMGPPSAPTPRTILTPKRHFPHLQGQSTPGCETPLINKRLSLAMAGTPQSPNHVATPQTPYGRIFKDDPSPQTRKEWVQWADSFPDIRVEEPPLKRRAPSTPLSAIREQFWQKIKEPIGSNKDDEVFVEQGAASASRDKTLANVSKYTNNKDENLMGTSPIAETPINRKLNFSEENSESKKPIELQIEHLDQFLQATSSTAESRYSLSGNAKLYEKVIEPMDRDLVKFSQPETVCWEDPAQHKRPSYKPTESITGTIEDEAPPETSRKFKFMLSGVKDRKNYENLIVKLGGDLSTDTNYDPTATHLLCLRPARNEKMLGSIAAGKWVLHCKYIVDCEVEGKFIDEEEYEWGNPLSKNVIPEPNGDTEKSIAAAAHRWRLKLHREPGGAFQEMVAILLVQKEKYDQFERLIKAGGGTVVQAKAPYDSSPGGKKVTHCLVQLNKLDQPVDWAMLASKGILCFQPQYLSDHLTAKKSTNPRDLVIPEFKKYLALLPR